MAIRIDMSSNDIDRQIELLKFYPEIVEKHFKTALKRSVKLAEAQIRPNIPVLTGTARNTFNSRVTGKGINLQGQIGWWGKSPAWYINIVEYGAKAHRIEARDGGFLGFGSTVVKSVNHPGFSKRGFMAAGFSSVQPIIDADMALASERVVNEMAVK